MVRGVAEQALGVGVEFNIGAGDSEKDYPVIESPSESHKTIRYLYRLWHRLRPKREDWIRILWNSLQDK